MGVSDTGRLAVLVNFHEKQPIGELSRGLLPVSYLTSQMSATDWANNTRSLHADALKLAGGFMMMFGDITPTNGEIQPLELLSNRQPPEVLLGDDCPVLCMSNGPLSDKSWEKTETLARAFEPLLSLHGDEFIKQCFKLLSTTCVADTLTIEDIRKTVFVPRCQLPGGPYATRTQTIVLVDRKGQVTYMEKTLGPEAGDPDAQVEPVVEQFNIK